MKPQWTGALALAASAVAAVALAHNGAMGVVLERMNGMTAMRDTVAVLAPMMQGAVPYDAFAVSEGAGVIAGHAGETMLSLFPEGSLEGVTHARPEIWSDWQDFADLAKELKTYADAFAEAAPNGLEPAPQPRGGMAGMDHSAMAMAPEPEANRRFTVAELMGYGDKTPEIPVARGASNPAMLAVDLTTLAANDLFTRISATCSSCHSRFRAGRT
ncbi:MAG: cytochrome c [Proteobacteria bacterium]|nr:cytochrome c [Pseudomonadota bacterium]